MSDQSAFCPRCGTALDAGNLPTVTTPHTPTTPSPSRPPSHPSSGSFDQAGFAPGQIFAERYRIVGLLGRGGMGEVYRADDLKLGQPVALKFLAPKFAREPELMQRFYAEVRLARQVSHPHVCRVHDVGEAAGHLYLSMEYVDGEDLASLLKRIGRLPPDKALDIARELCAGLAAAHDKGVLHRDLKPANVMLDGRGHARITDFGLAIPADEGESERRIAGTPAYMAPEQLTGGEVTPKTDLYALGLILYEVFTGKRAFEAKSVIERMRTMETARPESVTGISGADPAVERVILRCLENDPAKRPASALAVAAALPGGDPLAAALAAGETPSPEMVAAAGEQGALKPAVALACIVAFVVGLLGVVALYGRVTLYRRIPLDAAPAVLEARAKEIINRFGYPDRPADSTWSIGSDASFLRWIEQNDKYVGRWKQVEKNQPAVIVFFYRQSPRELVPINMASRVTGEDPPPTVSGMINVALDMRGRLLTFRAVPPQRDDSPDTGAEADWRPVFEAAGLDLAKFTSVAPQWTPLNFAEKRFAWTGAFPDRPDIALRVEAASYRGKPAYFTVVSPFARPTRMESVERTFLEKISQWTNLSVLITALVVGAWLARHNVRLGRGDRSGALKLAAFMFAAELLRWAFVASHSGDIAVEWGLFERGAGGALFGALQIWLMYLALEPYVRRRWPQTLISWNRMLAGKFRDPLVGRDVLVGALAAVGFHLLACLVNMLPGWLGKPEPTPPTGGLTMLGKPAYVLAIFADQAQLWVAAPLIILVVWLVFRLVLRKQALALGGLGVVMVLLTMGGTSWFQVFFGVIISAMILVVLIRFGAVALGAFAFFIGSIVLPTTLHPSAWYFAQSLAVLLTLIALTGFAFYTSLGTQKLFAGALLEEET